MMWTFITTIFAFIVLTAKIINLEALTRDSNLDFLLPSAVRPYHQLVRVQPLINGNFSLIGYTEIYLNITETTSNITLHLADLTVDTSTMKLVRNADLADVPIVSTEYDPINQFFITYVAKDALLAGETYTVYMKYMGFLNDKLVGLYRSYYTDENGNEINFAVSQFAPTYARYAFPCFDEPEMKATFTVQILREENMVALSNMPILYTVPMESAQGWYMEIYEDTPLMSTYLVAFLVSDFVNMSSTSNQVLYEVWTRQQGLQQATYALSIAPQVISFYDSYFGIPYALPKVDMAAVPDFYYGAMENWGLVIYRETSMLYDPLLSSAANKQTTCAVIAHELAHQWFGNLVTFEWWNDVWLNEGFATFMEFPGCAVVEPSFEMINQFVTDDLQKVFEIDSLETSHPLSQAITTSDQIYQVYDTIAYSKGASIIRMMDFFLTQKTFRKGISNYLSAFSYANAKQDDLWFYLTQQGHADGTLEANLTVKMIMDTWTLQKGYPVLTVQRFSDGSANLTQSRFVLVSNDTTAVEEYVWYIPLTYATQDDPNSSFTQTTVKEWMKPSEKQKTMTGFPTKDKWVIFNVQQNGYFRVNYDSENWDALINQFLTNNAAIHVINRAQILDDGYTFARLGLLPYETILSINSYLNQEIDYVPAKTALNRLDYLFNMFKTAVGFGSFESYMLALIVPIYDAIGFDDSLTGPHMEQMKRALIVDWTCRLNYAPAVMNSVDMYSQWMSNPSDNSIISPNLRSPVYCSAIADGDSPEWDFAFEQYLTTDVANQKSSLIYGMGCSQQILILQRYLDMTFTEASGIRKQDVKSVFISLEQNVIGRDLAWNYITQNSDAIAAYMGSYQSVADLTSIISKNFNTVALLAQMEVFKVSHLTDFGASVQTIDQSMETVTNNIAWMMNYYDEVNTWLIDNGYGTSSNVSLC